MRGINVLTTSLRRDLGGHGCREDVARTPRSDSGAWSKRRKSCRKSASQTCRHPKNKKTSEVTSAMLKSRPEYKLQPLYIGCLGFFSFEKIIYQHRPQAASAFFRRRRQLRKFNVGGNQSKYTFLKPPAVWELHARTQSRDTEPSHRVQGRGQDKDMRRTRPGHRAGPQSPATEFRGAATRTRGGHRAGPQSPARQGQEEDKARTQSPATEFRGAASECGQL